MLIVNDATKDERFSANDLVTGEPGIRFYAGTPLVNPEGLTLGSLCVIDRKPRTMSDQQQDILHQLGKQAMILIESRKTAFRLAETIVTLDAVKNFLSVCSVCKKVKIDKDKWSTFDDFLQDHKDFTLSHGYCEDCYHEEFPD